MYFHTTQFLIFLPVVTMGYFVLPKALKNMWLLAASYYFYMCWNPVYALLMLASTVTTYLCSYLIITFKGAFTKKLALFINISANLGILFFFKYYKFAASLLTQLLAEYGIEYAAPVFSILLPAGISFYTFQALGYSIDVYRGKVAHEKNFFTYALFVSFFPQLVAGPIERSGHLLPQFHNYSKPNAKNISFGCQMMLLGFFKKIVIADGFAVIVNTVYKQPADFSPLAVAMAAVFFCFQVYCDFSGYSDIALGAAKILNFDLMYNFRSPYLATGIDDFWARWHISLSSWFKDYVYVPLGGNRKGKFLMYVNLFITFLISGMWHGANLTYILWGAFHGVYTIISRLTAKARAAVVRFFNINAIPILPNLVRQLFTFTMVTIALILFRAQTIGQAFDILKMLPGIFSPTAFAGAALDHTLRSISFFSSHGPALLACMAMLLILELLSEKYNSIMDMLCTKPFWARYALYYAMLLTMLFYGSFGNSQFIYFVF